MSKIPGFGGIMAEFYEIFKEELINYYQISKLPQKKKKKWRGNTSWCGKFFCINIAFIG